MSRSSLWLALPVLLLVFGAVPSNATPEAPSAVDFLAELSAPPCLAESQMSVPAPELPLQVPEAQARVIYPDCGYYCSDVYCSGKRTLGSCTTRTGAAGFCKAVNQVCTGEPMHSPCTCTAF